MSSEALAHPVAVTYREEAVRPAVAGPWRVLRWLALALVLLFFLAPIAYLVLISLKPQPEILSGQLLPSRIAWENWPNAFASVNVLLFLRNSVIVAALSAAITMAITVPATYAMVRFRAGGSFLRSLVLSSYVAPPIVAVIPLFYLLKWAQLIDTLPGLALVHGLANMPVAIWLHRQLRARGATRRRGSVLGRRRGTSRYHDTDRAATDHAGPGGSGHHLYHPVVQRVPFCPGHHLSPGDADAAGRHCPLPGRPAGAVRADGRGLADRDDSRLRGGPLFPARSYRGLTSGAVKE